MSGAGPINWRWTAHITRIGTDEGESDAHGDRAVLACRRHGRLRQSAAACTNQFHDRAVGSDARGSVEWQHGTDRVCNRIERHSGPERHHRPLYDESRERPAGRNATVNGLAVATFLAGSSSGVADVRAVSGGATGTGATTTTNLVQITIGAAAITGVVVQASPSSVPASGGSVEIVATATGASNLTLSGVGVTFSATAGTLSATSGTTDGNGQARVSSQPTGRRR